MILTRKIGNSSPVSDMLKTEIIILEALHFKGSGRIVSFNFTHTHTHTYTLGVGWE